MGRGEGALVPEVSGRAYDAQGDNPEVAGAGPHDAGVGADVGEHVRIRLRPPWEGCQSLWLLGGAWCELRCALFCFVLAVY